MNAATLLDPPTLLEYAGETSFFEGTPPLSQSVGYLVVLGFGAAFSVFTTLIVYANQAFGVTGDVTSEHFKYVHANCRSPLSPPSRWLLALANHLLLVPQHGWAHGQDWSHCVGHCQSVDVGRHASPKLQCGLALRSIGALLVRTLWPCQDGRRHNRTIRA
jgi:hypothetical protein